MKSLKQFDNLDKAALLFQLFPEEIPSLVAFIDGMCLTVMEDETRLRSSWDNGLITFDAWLSWAREIHTRIRKYGNALHQNKRLFTDQLFDGQIGAFTTSYIIQWEKTSLRANKSFDHALRMLFDF